MYTINIINNSINIKQQQLLNKNYVVSINNGNDGKLLINMSNRLNSSGIYFNKIIYGSVTSLPIDIYKLGKKVYYDNDTILCLYNKNIYFYGSNNPIILNNRSIQFNTHNYSKYNILTDESGEKTIIGTNFQIYYQGYYSDKSFYDNNVVEIINEIENKSGRNILINDSLLCKRIISQDNQKWCIFRVLDNEHVTYSDINNSILYYNNETSRVMFLKKEGVQYILNDDVDYFDNTNNLISSYNGLGLPNYRDDKKYLYLDFNTFKFYKFYQDSWYNVILNINIISYLNLYTNTISTLKLIDNYFVDAVNVFQYKTYYTTSYIKQNPNYNDVYNLLYYVKNGKPSPGDLLLVELNNTITLYKIDSVQYNNFSILTTPNIFFYNDYSTVKLYLVDKILNKVSTYNEFIFPEVIDGYYINVINPPEILNSSSKKFYFNGNDLYMLYYDKLTYIYSWIKLYLGLYTFVFKVNPRITIHLDDNSSYDTFDLDSSILNNQIIFNNVIINSDLNLPLPDLNFKDDLIFLTNSTYNGQIITCGDVYLNNVKLPDLYWISYNNSPIMAIITNGLKQYVYNAGTPEFYITQDRNFSGTIVDELPNVDDYKFGELILLMDSSFDRGKVYELSYEDNSSEPPYKWRVLCEEQCYFKAIIEPIEINKCINYLVNNIGENAYIAERALSNYFVGYVVNDIQIWGEGKYYSLNFEYVPDISDINYGREYILGNICICNNGKLDIVLMNGEPYEIYNKQNGSYVNFNKINKTYVFTQVGLEYIYGLKDYSGYCIKVNDLNDKPSINYKENSFVLTYINNLIENIEVRIYLRYNNDYVLVSLLDKTIFKNISNGKLYIIENNLINKIKSGIKLSGAIENKYVNTENVITNFKQNNKGLNLFTSYSRCINQTLLSTDKGFIKFKVQPPINAKHVENNESNKCSLVIMDNDNNWLFDSSKILSGNNISIVFEYYENGVNYDLLYNINRKHVENLMITSFKFYGFINFEKDEDVKEEYQLTTLDDIVNITYQSIINDYINNNGEFIVINSGTYNLTVLINYQYEANVENLFYNNNKPYYSLNNQNDELIKKYIQYVNYNTSPIYSYSLITSGIVELNIILDLNVNDKVFIIYHNNSNQLNIQYTNCYFNVYKLY